MIRAGQIYEAVKPNPGDPHNTRRRIRIISEPGWTHGVYGYAKVTVETIRPDGTGTRQRRIEITQLHQTATTRTGAPRSNGYVLIQNTEETPR